jgi:hypothetical protein
MTPFYVLTWTPREDGPRSFENAVQSATEALWREPERCSYEGKALLAAKVQEGWATSESAKDMMRSLGRWAHAKGKDSPEHREVVRLLVLCVQTAPDLTDKDRQALDLLKAWRAGGQSRRKKTDMLVSSKAVKNTVEFAREPSHNPLYAMHYVLRSVASPEETERILADLIRRERPLPPVVD